MSEKKYLPDYVGSYEELIDVFEEFNIDSEKTRFFIGRAYTDPKAFVIYQDDFGDFVVYKNKDDGSMALRYKGNDEEYAVNEYYQKFLEEISKRPAFAKKLLTEDQSRSYVPKSSSPRQRLSRLFSIIITAWFVGSMVIGGAFYVKKAYDKFYHRKDGYYQTSDYTYYRQGRKMYYYDTILDTWYYYGYYDDFDDYYDTWDYHEYYDDNEDYRDFEKSEYYDDWESEYDDDDSGWSDSDSWDSWDVDTTDWGSDW